MALLAVILYIYVRIVKSFVFARIVCAYALECAYARAYKIYMCACICIRVSLCMFTCINANAVSYVCLRACLIKTQNAFAHKIFQHSYALWVQKLSGCTIVILVFLQHQWLPVYTGLPLLLKYSWIWPQLFKLQQRRYRLGVRYISCILTAECTLLTLLDNFL